MFITIILCLLCLLSVHILYTIYISHYPAYWGAIDMAQADTFTRRFNLHYLTFGTCVLYDSMSLKVLIAYKYKYAYM